MEPEIYKSYNCRFKARLEQVSARAYKVDFYQGRSMMFSSKFSSYKKAKRSALQWVEESGK